MVILMKIVNLEKVEFLKEILIKQAFSVTQKDMKTGDSILHIAVFQGKNDFVRAMLLSQPIPLFELEDINIRNEDGNTPLSYACIKGNLDLVKLLHSKGASMVHKNLAGLSPLILAIYQSHYFIVHYLLSIEQVYESVSTALELYKCLQFSISSTCGGSSSQIFYLLQEVFDSKIEDIFSHF
jgi:ankyrin repeat protein